jgi:hypothetical protein
MMAGVIPMEEFRKSEIYHENDGAEDVKDKKGDCRRVY